MRAVLFAVVISLSFADAFSPQPPQRAGSSPPLPSKSQVAWLNREVGALFQFNIGEYGTQINDYACRDTSQPPIPASMFTPMALNTTAWMETTVAMGAKHAVLTTQAGCGFDLWHTNATLPGGAPYNYTVRESPFGRDIVREFVDAARAAGIKPGLYYIINQNYFLSFSDGKIVPRTAPGQQQVTDADYEAIVLAQLRELWTAYGSLVELWFDGGCPPSLKDKVAALLEELQPDAVRFQGPSNSQAVRWIGSESGKAPEPNWITANGSLDFGPGEADGPVVAPSEADTTMASTSLPGFSGTGSPGSRSKRSAPSPRRTTAALGTTATFCLEFPSTIPELLLATAVRGLRSLDSG